MPRYADARLVAMCRLRGLSSTRPEDWDRDARAIPAYVVYNELRAIPIDANTKMTMEIQRQADVTFDRLIAPLLGGYKLEAKRRHFQLLFCAGKLALYHSGCVQYSRDYRTPNIKARLAVVGAAITAGLFVEHRSPPGSPKMTRLLPLSPFEDMAIIDPWTIDGERQRELVFVRDRESKEEEVSFDRGHPVAVETQETLETCNAFIARYEITHQRFSLWEREARVRLRPVLYALFTGDFDHHGRLYTGKYGHQELSREERATIEFNDEPCVELDYSGLHCRMLYHLREIPFEGDPYVLENGFGHFPEQRYLVKTIVNAAINAASPEDAVSACNNKRRTRTKTGEWKQGKELDRALKLTRALEKTGTSFKEIYGMARRSHLPIGDDFCSDAGMRLMRVDGKIALRVLSRLTKRGIIPSCLRCSRASASLPNRSHVSHRSTFAPGVSLPLVR